MSIEQVIEPSVKFNRQSWQPSISDLTAEQSDELLLQLFAEKLQHLAQYHWYESDSLLIDAHAIACLDKVCRLNLDPSGYHKIAKQLAPFITTHIQPLWEDIDFLSHSEKHQHALDLVESMALQVFDDNSAQSQASWLLYYLCPQFPVFAMTTNTRKTLEGKVKSYRDYHSLCTVQLSRLLPYIHENAPAPSTAIQSLIQGSNWWQRSCLFHHLAQR